MINLGDEAKDSITGYKGIAICRHTYLQGCDRITLATKVTKDNPDPMDCSFDEPQLILIKAKKVVGNGDKVYGGPARHMPKPKSTGIKR